MRDSLFSLCPRGYGPTSFRLYESIQLGSIPVYIAEDDEHIALSRINRLGKVMRN